MIFILEGADGTGKTTLARAIANTFNGEVIHATYNRKWNIKKYHHSIWNFATQLDACGINPVLDRFAASERVYGNVFRDGESYDTDSLVYYINDVYANDVRWIYCRNDNAAENHLKNKKNRVEMYDDMTDIAKEFEKYAEEHKDLGWFVFDYDKVDTGQFLLQLMKGEGND